MKTEIVVENCSSPFCQIHASEKTEQILEFAEKVSKLDICGKEMILMGWDGDFALELKPSQIFKVFSQDKKVFVQTEKETLLLKMRLYEFEELSQNYGWNRFVRISNTDIINLDNVLKFDMTLSGVIKIYLKNGSFAVVSRRYMNAIRSVLCLKK